MKKDITIEELDRKFDEGEEDILEYFDLSKARIVEPEIRRVNVDIPAWLIHKLDREAARLGIARQALIKVWLAERADSLKS